MDALGREALVFLLMTGSLLGLVGIGEALRKWGQWTAEGSRRVVHLGVGIAVAATPHLFDRAAPVYLLAVGFVVVNYVLWRRGGWQSLHGTARRSLGTVTFPLALLPALVLCWTLAPGRLFALQLAFLILALADPIASFVGERWGPKTSSGAERPAKTMAGSIAFFGAACLVCGGALWWFRNTGRIDWSLGEIGLAAVITSIITTAVEALGRRGWDNFFIVQASLVVLVVFNEQPEARGLLAAVTVAGAAFGAVTYRARFLSGSGALAGGLLAASVLGLGGWAWAVPSLTFFVTSSLLSRVGAQRKTDVEAVSEKGSRRDAGQVYANGGVGWVLLVLYVFWPADVLYCGFLGAFAAAAADTWGTEIGALSSQAPRLLTTGRPVARGTSGAVTLLGTVGALAGALVVGLSAWVVAAVEPLPSLGGVSLLVVVLAGGLGSFIDSLAGATIQARFRDPRTGRETERSESTAGRHPLLRGWRWFRNDQINALCTFTGAVVAMACFQVANFAF